MPRPTKLNSTVQAAIVESVRNGNYPKIAARAGGVSESTYHNWIARGQEGGPPNAAFVAFLDAVMQAEAEAEVKIVKAIYDFAMNPTGRENRAGTDFLRRRYSDRWGTADRISGKVQHTHTHETSEKVDREIKRLLGELDAERNG